MASGIDPRYDDPSNYPPGYDDDYPPDWDARRSSVYQRDDYTCQLCGQKSGPHADDGGVPLHAHHRVPLSRGGSNALGNLITLCESCHEDHHGHEITSEESPRTGAGGSARTGGATPTGSNHRPGTGAGDGEGSLVLGLVALYAVYPVGVQAVLHRAGFGPSSLVSFPVGIGFCAFALVVGILTPARTAVAAVLWAGLFVLGTYLQDPATLGTLETGAGVGLMLAPPIVGGLLRWIAGAIR